MPKIEILIDGKPIENLMYAESYCIKSPTLSDTQNNTKKQLPMPYPQKNEFTATHVKINKDGDVEFYTDCMRVCIDNINTFDSKESANRMINKLIPADLNLTQDSHIFLILGNIIRKATPLYCSIKRNSKINTLRPNECPTEDMLSGMLHCKFCDLPYDHFVDLDFADYNKGWFTDKQSVVEKYNNGL
ncbi:hypothetical protein J6A31_06335 [bacterium]|nr:hypothetical protein [bacterium]